MYFESLLKGFPLELGSGARGQETRMMGLPRRERSLTISSAVWIQCTNVTDRRTERRTSADSKDRIASRGKNQSLSFGFKLSVKTPFNLNDIFTQYAHND